MAEYIEKEAAKAIVANWPMDTVKDNMRARDALDTVPAADVRENVRGRWTDEAGATSKSYVFVCSVCKRSAYYVPHGPRKGYVRNCGYNFCPNCGADMRGRDDG